MGCAVVGYDINPMAYWVVKQEIGSLDIEAYRAAAARVEREVRSSAANFYLTECAECGTEVPAKYYLWVKVLDCAACGQQFDLFPGYLLSENRRHPRNVIVCATCGELAEVADRGNLGTCPCCGTPLRLGGPASRNRCPCPHCGEVNRYPNPKGPPRHRMFAIEYHCSHCKPRHLGRFFKRPDSVDLARYDEARSALTGLTLSFVPDELVPRGDETDRLHRWGYRRYREMFNARQVLGLELLCRSIAEEKSVTVRNALATNLSDLLRYQNMLCRYDTQALKSLDIFSVHGFPVGLVQCESNIFGILSNGVVVGSGGWGNIVEKYLRAKQYCVEPFEIGIQDGRKTRIPIPGEWIGERRQADGRTEIREVQIVCGDGAEAELPEHSLDAVLTDPPYFANVQYAELMDFCFVWLRRLASDETGVFDRHSTRSPHELTGNITMERGLSHFARGLAETYARMARALKPGAPFAFTYHHNMLDAYYPIAIAVLDAGLVCSASLPCPAEMGASIHINGTGSSVIDTVFVCRSTGLVDRRTIVDSPKEVAELVIRDSDRLRRAGIRCSPGDLRCIAFGHIVRLAIWYARPTWDRRASVRTKLERIALMVEELGGSASVEDHLHLARSEQRQFIPALLREEQPEYAIPADLLEF